ncbi:MAG: hypothetical protein ACNJA3_28505 (plasmid) [Pseudomonas rhizophila]|uniref:hypothetical protein n=1 Tax=Pseudomonas rhizophila TaxID=2045200 RepID=UPI003F6C45EA
MKNTHAMTVTLDANAVEALSRYRQALSAFEVVGHGTDEGADLFLASERAAEELGKQIAALAPDVAPVGLTAANEGSKSEPYDLSKGDPFGTVYFAGPKYP